MRIYDNRSPEGREAGPAAAVPSYSRGYINFPEVLSTRVHRPTVTDTLESKKARPEEVMHTTQPSSGASPTPSELRMPSYILNDKGLPVWIGT